MVAVRFHRRLEFDVGENLGEKKVRTVFAVQNHRVLAEPSEARIRRPFALEDWSGVDVRARDRAGTKPLNQTADRARPLPDDVVIVAAERVGSDSAAQLAAPIDLGRRARRVRIAQAHDRPVARVEPARVEPPLSVGVAREVSHRRMTAVSEPSAIEGFAIVEGMESGKSNQRESQFMGGAGHGFR